MHSLNHFFDVAPNWRPMAQWPASCLMPYEWSWLQESGSLTRRLQTQFPDAFRVRVLGQAWSRPFLQDAQSLGLRHARTALVREVQLLSRDSILICARTTIPPKTLHGLKRLARVGSRSLGEVIFSYPDLQRIGLDLARIDRADASPLLRAAMGDQAHIWGRRNTYAIAGRAFLVSEFFLPCVTDD